MNPSTNVSAFSNFLCHKVARVFCGLLLTLWLLPSAFAQAQPGTATPPATQREAEPRLLEVGKPIERELAGGQSHAYQLTLAEGQYLNLVVDQRGIDVVVTLFRPDGKKLLEVDSPNGTEGPEPLRLIIEAAGSYQLEVHSLENNAKPGKYEVKIIELRVATARDREYMHDLAETDKLYRQLNNLYQKGQYDQAIPLATRVLALREKSFGAEHPATATWLDNLALLYRAQGDYGQAEPFQRRALAIREKVLGVEHPETAASLDNLAELYRAQGDYGQAEPFYRRALAIREKVLGAEHPETAISLNNLASLYRIKGDYRQAEALHRRALVIREKVLGAEHPNTAASLNNLAELYRVKGDYVQAEALQRRAVAIYEKVLGVEHPFTAASLDNLALLYRAKGDYGQAEPFQRRALAIREKVLGVEHPETAISLNNLALIYDSKGDYEQAEPFYRRALAINEKVLGAEHPETANSLNNLASLYRIKGDYRQAEALHRRALVIREKVLGAEHPNTATSLDNLAELYEAKSDIPRAISFRARAQAIEEHNISLNLATGSERQKIAYLKTMASVTACSVRLHVRLAPADQTARDLALTAILQRKGRVLEALNDGTEALRRRANPQDLALLDQLKEARAQLAKLVLGGPQRVSPAEHQQAIKRLEESVEKLEAELGNQSAEFRIQSKPVTIAAVQAVIPTNAALIEFYRYDYKESHYVAYVLRQRGEAQWVDLGEAKETDEVIAALRRAISKKDEITGKLVFSAAEVKKLARAVEAKVMQPLRQLLGQTQRVLLSPDGALSLVPFAALVDEKNHYLAENYEFSYLTSGRDLLRLQVKQANKQAAMVVANPDFGDEAANAKAQERILKYRPGATEQSREDGLLSDYYFPPLDGTAEEARELKVLMTDATVLTQGQATETALKRVSSPRILHVATHGFFLEDSKTNGDDGRELKKVRLSLDEPPVGKIENPLLRSGLALAGANLQKSGDDDGILTAQEAAGLDLFGTKLVVLSACDTGVGEVKNGEGVYGLRRALVLAGAETQVMSLWPVSDKGTRDLMIKYYRRLLRGEGRSAALRQVQLQMLKAKAVADENEERLLVTKSQKEQGRISTTKSGKKPGEKAAPKDYSHPYYWASFIQSGEWANLDGKR